MSRSLAAVLARGGRLAVLLVSGLLLLLAQVSDHIHEAATPHVVCAEHERIEDAPHADGSSREEGGPGLAAAPDSGGQHHACALPLTPNGAGVLTWHPPTIEEPVVEPLAEVRLPEGAPGRTGPPLLHVAPKLSPPRA